MASIIGFIIVLGILIFVHEFGHYIAARLMGVRVLVFSFGFGPRLIGKKIGDTDYCLSLYPLGGYVRLFGDNPEDLIDEHNKQYAFYHKPVWRRAVIVLAGPLFNIVFAWLIFFVLILSMGNPVLLPIVGATSDGSPAQKVGIMKDDEIISINGIRTETWDEMTKLIRNEGKKGTLIIEVKRGEEILRFEVTPEIKKMKNIFGEEIDTPIIGISSKGQIKVERLNPIESFEVASIKLYEILKITIQGFIKLFQGVLPLSTLGGPILIGQMAGEQLQYGIVNFVYFIALLSVNLGIINLLPIPILDGGHLMFYLIEAIRGKGFTFKEMEYAQKVGMIILGILMIIVFYNDIARLLGLLPPIPKP